MTSPEDERAAFWKAVQVNSDRITELEAVVETRNDMMRDTIRDAVQQAMPTALISDEEHRWLKLQIERQSQSVAFRKKIIESSAIWGVLLLGGWVLLVLKEYAVAHGMWKP
mgnify:CR=1 FL=1